MPHTIKRMGRRKQEAEDGLWRRDVEYERIGYVYIHGSL
jgi:hypothetical protein